MPYFEDELWGQGVFSVSENEVYSRSGKQIHLGSIIKRRWGWPKKASSAAAKILSAEFGDDPVTLWVGNPHRHEQQMRLLTAHPEILKDLFSGLSRGAQRDINDAGVMTSGVAVKYSRPEADEGFGADILRCVASHLGITMEELRRVTEFSSVGDELVVRVDNWRLDNDD